MEPSKKHKKEFFDSRGLNRLKFSSAWSLITTFFSGILTFVFSSITLSKVAPKLKDFFRFLIKSIRVFSGQTDLETHTVAALNNISATPDLNSLQSFDFKPVLNLAIMLTITIAFLWSFGVSMHSSDENRVKTANDTNKMILGFLLGSAKSYLGLP